MNQTLARIVGGMLVVLVVLSGTEPVLAQQAQPPEQPPAQNAPTTPKTSLPPPELPESPGKSSSSRPANAAPTQGSQEPSGTAVAPPIETRGGAASKPAGVALAPPKQRQVRSLLIKLGLLAGAGVAVGTVVGLSAASPGHVPNSPGH